MPQLTFTVEDCKSPERLERLFRRLNKVLAEPSTPASPSMNPAQLANAIAPLVRDQLQAPGAAPLNLQSLLPSQGLGVVLEDTHANRLTTYLPGGYATGTLFWETDRTSLYVTTSSSGTPTWTYVAGLYRSTFANRATDLGANDTGFAAFITTGTAGVIYLHRFVWNGSSWNFDGEPSGFFIDSAVSLAAYGYQLCDGTATTYIVPSGADLAEVAFTTPDENSGAAGVYHKSIAAYTGTINAATAGAISGSTANTTATNQAASTGITVADHPDHRHEDITDDGAAKLFTEDLVGGKSARTGNQLTTSYGALTLSHSVTDPTHNHTQDAHSHGAGTLAVATTGQPRNMGVLRFFRN